MLLANARYVPTECDARTLRTKLEALEVAGQIAVGVRGEKIDFVTERTERKSLAARIECRLIKGQVGVRLHRVGVERDLKLLWFTKIITEIPANDVCWLGGKIQQFDRI